MISYRMIMLIVGLIFVFILAIITGVSTLNRGGWTVIPFLAVLAYFAYILKQVCDEWNIYRMDKENGVETAELEFLHFLLRKVHLELSIHEDQE